MNFIKNIVNLSIFSYSLFKECLRNNLLINLVVTLSCPSLTSINGIKTVFSRARDAGSD